MTRLNSYRFLIFYKTKVVNFEKVKVFMFMNLFESAFSGIC